MLKRLCNIPKDNSFFLFGPRQTGKSTIVSQSFSPEETLSYNLLKSDEYQRLVARPALFREEVIHREARHKFVFVDEIQRIPELLNEIHLLIESSNPPIFILTGSSARKLRRGHANMLAGRAWSLELFPLTAQELQGEFNLDQALQWGTLPKIYLEKEIQAKERHLQSYVDTYLKEEIEAEALLRNAGSFLRFLPLAAESHTKVIHYARIARTCNVADSTIKNYFKILEDTLIARLLLPYAGSTRKRLIKHPKFYLFDGGVQRAILRRAALPIARSTYEFGDAFEGWFINEAIRLNSYLRKNLNFSFYRTDQGAEVDLIVENPQGKVLAIEIKSSEDPQQEDFASGLESFRAICPKCIPYVACNAARARSIKGVEVLPWKQILDLLRDQ